MYRKSVTRKCYERKVAKCAAMRSAKSRKRLSGDGLVECGGCMTWGSMGNHDIRLLAWPDDVKVVAVVVDGAHKRPRSLRGVWRCVAKMIGGKHER